MELKLFEQLLEKYFEGQRHDQIEPAGCFVFHQIQGRDQQPGPNDCDLSQHGRQPRLVVYVQLSIWEKPGRSAPTQWRQRR